jgi:hypothetical protein
LRQRLLYIILIVVVVLVGYTILRPKPKARAKIQVSEKSTPQVKTPTTPTTTNITPKPESIGKSSPPAAKIQVAAETLKPTMPDTTKTKVVKEKTKPVTATTTPAKIDTSKLAISSKPDTSKIKAGETAITPLVQKKEEETIKWGSDPFIRDWVLATEIKDLKLTAVTISGTKAYALINGQILGQGEVIMGKRIVDIERDKVILEQGGRQFTLFLGE